MPHNLSTETGLEESKSKKGRWLGLLAFVAFLGAIGWVAMRSRRITAGQASELLVHRMKSHDSRGIAAFISEAEVKEYFLDRSAAERFIERVLLPLMDVDKCTVAASRPNELESPIGVTFVGKQGHMSGSELYFRSEAYRPEIDGWFRCLFRAAAVLNFDEAKAKAAGKGTATLTEEDYLVQTHKTLLSDVGLKIIPDRKGKSDLQRKLEGAYNPPVPMGDPYTYKP